MMDSIIFFGCGAFLIFVGVLQIGNVRRAIRTGTIALGAFDTSRMREVNRDKNPLLYQLNFWPCVFAAVGLPLIGVGLIGAGIFFLVQEISN
jgi:hypothetical protein